MRDASFVACAGQALLGGYFGGVLLRGAKTDARRALAHYLVGVSGYSAVLGVYYATEVPFLRLLFEPVAVAVALVALLDLLAFASWNAAGADPSRRASVPWLARAFAVVVLAGLCVVQVTRSRPDALVEWPEALILAASLLGQLVTLVLFGVAWRGSVPGARGYLLAVLAPLVPMVLNVIEYFGVNTDMSAYRLVRDLCVLVMESALLTTYLNHGQEPMSLRDRIVSGVLMTVTTLTIAVARLALPENTSSVAPRLVAVLVVAVVAVATLVPLVFRASVLVPVERLTAGLARAETGERVELPAEREDELGAVMRSFNRMVAALAEGRDALAEKVRQLETRQTEIASLNDELRRQIAARSRQLADALRLSTAPTEAIQPGVVIDGRYEVEGELGAGGMGRVYGAKRLHDGRELALKVITGGKPDDAVRFMQEAELAATLSHENLVSVVDVGMHAGTPWFVMERLTGGSLADASARFGDASFMLPVLLQIARGLEALHVRGVLHRDLKPANVLLAGDAGSPVAKIADFGIASTSVVSELGATIPAGADVGLLATAPGVVMGTLPYVAPELAEGPAAYGPRSDVYAFGVLAWEVLAGSLPYRVPTLFLAMSGAEIAVPSAEAVKAPPAIADLLVRCISPSPTTRPSVTEILRVLCEAS